MFRYFFNSSCQRNYNLRYSRTGVFGEIKRRFILNIQIKAFVVKELKHWWKRDRTMASNISKIEILRLNYSTISTIKVSNKHNVICNSLTTIIYFLIQKFFYKIKSTTYLWRKSWQILDLEKFKNCTRQSAVLWNSFIRRKVKSYLIRRIFYLYIWRRYL